MRPLLSFLLLLAVTVCLADARADAPTTMFVRNLGSDSTRVQVSIGVTLPCDSSDDRLVFDAELAPGETRTFPVGDAISVCARSTSPGSSIDWQPSVWRSGGYKCRGGRGGRCWRDPSVPIVFDVQL